jgi:outer membrane protein TolC
MRSTSRLLRLASFLLCAALPLTASAQDQPAAAAEQPTTVNKLEQRYSERQLSTVLQSAEETKTRPTAESAQGLGRPAFLGTYFAHFVPPLSLRNTERLQDLIHQGKLYLSLHDAILLAVENNLDVEQQRYQIAMAGTDVIRAKGGGVTRGLPLTVAQSPVGIGGPGSPLLNSAASTGAVSPTASTVANVFDVNQLTEATTNLSLQGPTPFSSGPPIPGYDPTLVGQLAWMHLQSIVIPPVKSVSTNNAFANLTLAQGISTGAQFLIGSTNASDLLNFFASSPDPFRSPNVVATVVQPLFRGFGVDVNRRYIRIAQNNLKVSRLIFRQQLNDLIFGVSRLYYDLVSLNEDVKVKQETLAAAQQLYQDDKSQVEVGTLAPLELTRAQALVSASELDLTRAQGLVVQQEAVLKSAISRTGTGDSAISAVRVVPTDTIIVPETEKTPALPELTQQGLANRADLAQAAIQVKNAEITVKASRNQVRPEIDLIGAAMTRGNIGSSSIIAVAPVVLPPSTPAGKESHLYEAGVQVNVPFRNRIAQADAARDEIQLRQMQGRLQQLENQVRDEIENALTALQVARAAYVAAVRSRQFQEQLLDAEMQKLSVGASINFFIVQDEGFLAQARSTEVVARSTYIKSRVSLERAIGTLLESHNIQLDDAIRGELPGLPPAATEPPKSN